MGGGPTPETKSQTTQTNEESTSTSGPPEYLQPYLKQAVEGMAPYLNKWGAGGAPPLYPENYTVAPSDATSTAISDYSNYRNPFTGANNALTNQTLQGDFLNLDKNPYFQGAIAASLREPTYNFANKIIPTLRSTFAGAGRPGAGLEGTALQDATRNFNQAVTDSTAKVGAQAYGDERNRQLTTQSMLPSFQNMDANRIAMNAQGGKMLDELNQKLLDERVQRFNYAQTGGLDFLTGLSQRLQGAWPGGTTEGTKTGTSESTGTGTPAGNPGAENAKLAMAGVATAVSIAAMFV